MDTIYNITKTKKKYKYLKNLEDIEKIIHVMPNYKLNVDITDERVEGKENILLFNINIIRSDKNKINTNENKKLGYLHSNNYFDNYNEEIVVIIFEKKQND